MQDVFNPDLYKQRQTQQDRAEIARKTEELIKNGGKVQKIASSVSSGIGDLSIKEREHLKKKSERPMASLRGNS